MTTIASPSRFRLNLDAFHALAAVGVFPPHVRVELIDGDLIEMPAIGSRHAAMVSRLVRCLGAQVAEQAIVSPQNPIILGQYSQPQPDICLLKPRADFYSEQLPTLADVLLLIEVSDSTLVYDRDEKLPLYARHGIAEVWLVDLPQAQLIAHRRPGSTGFSECITLAGDQRLSPVALPGLSIGLDDLG